MSKQVSSRRWGFTPANIPSDGIFDMGPAATSHGVGTMVIQFVMSENFVGSIAVLGRVFGVAAQEADAMFGPIPYRRVQVNGAASDYTMVADAITQPGIIQIPANGLAIGLGVSCSAGSCDVVSWDLMGPSAV